MSYLSNFFHLPHTISKIGFSLLYQKKFIHKTLKIDIENIKLVNDGSIDKEDLEKITQYYGLGVPGVLGGALSVLRGQKLSFEERMASTYIGAMTGLFDDFFDKKKFNDIELNYLLDAIVNNPNAEVKTVNEKSFLFFSKKVMANTKNPEMLKFYTSEVFKAQKLSLKQASDSISEKEIEQITLYKGGVSLLIYRSIINHPLSVEEKNMLYSMGGLWQLSNDIFDVYKDMKDEIKTLVTTAKDIKQLRKTFTDLMKVSFLLAYKTNFKQKNIKSFLRFISLGISRTFVCLDMLEQLQKSNKGVFNPHICTRKQLICDMEKPLNILKSLYYYIKYDIHNPY